MFQWGEQSLNLLLFRRVDSLSPCNRSSPSRAYKALLIIELVLELHFEG